MGLYTSIVYGGGVGPVMTFSSTKGVCELLKVGHHKDAFGNTSPTSCMGGVKNEVPEFHCRSSSHREHAVSVSSIG